eukprot:CAMPEP_0118991326 /NCGR_PEP_ID=MMETSP1173-20130426/51449_1 /TAXON_ID=1034831 /ORGANISM="Rhizochromulina marina cf, Strain CCMP1243" /LENGTH=66 /DNA_ID=CAMNT_0006942445 /DNA_START=33 /DNA_END=230 /DNA_ORIENTATION=-
MVADSFPVFVMGGSVNCGSTVLALLGSDRSRALSGFFGGGSPRLAFAWNEDRGPPPSSLVMVLVSW